MQNFVQVTIQVSDNEVKEQLIALLSLMNFDGYEENETSLLAFTNEEAFSEMDLEPIIKELGLEFSSSILPQQNWNALWESNFEPVVVDDFCAIRADFHAANTTTAHEIIITPKMSFGTGHHATTYLMIQQMRAIDFRNKIVADFGTGTGILAIMAEKLGAKKVVAIDYDDWCIENTAENISRNNCKAIEVVKADTFLFDHTFEIVLANINKNVILNNVQGIIKGLTKNGTLLLSGLLKEDETDIVDAFAERALKYVKTTERNNWITILLTT